MVLVFLCCDLQDLISVHNRGAAMAIMSPNRLLAKLTLIVAPFSKVKQLPVIIAVQYSAAERIVIPLPNKKKGMLFDE